MRKMKFREISIITILAGLIIVYINFRFLSDIPQVFPIMNMAAAIITLGIPLLYKYNEFSRIKKLETLLPKLLQDLTASISTGMTLPQAIRGATKNDYGVLSPYLKAMNAKMSFGIPFEIVLTDFASKSGSMNIRRNVHTIIETHRSGGSIDTVLASVAQSLQELEKIKKERSASVYTQMINGYLIYVVFLGVMIGLSSFLVPAFQWEQTSTEMKTVFVELFRSLIIIQGFFAGMSIGKMAEGTIVAGVKHSLVLVVFGYSLFILFG